MPLRGHTDAHSLTPAWPAKEQVPNRVCTRSQCATADGATGACDSWSRQPTTPPAHKTAGKVIPLKDSHDDFEHFPLQHSASIDFYCTRQDHILTSTLA